MTIEERLCKLEETYGIAEGKKKKSKKPYSSMSITTGDIGYNIAQFNKHMGTDNGGYLNGTIAGEACTQIDTAGMGGGDAGGCCEALELDEAKRYIRRYYIRPINKFASNKTEILKKLIEYEDQDLIVYTLINLGDTKDVQKLTSADIIYYYEDGILYDKNKVKVMDYDLYIKHEEERKKFAGDIETVSDAAFADAYADRMTDTTNSNDVKENLEEAAELTEAVDFKDIDKKKEFNKEWAESFLGMLFGSSIKYFYEFKKSSSGIARSCKIYLVDDVVVDETTGNIIIKVTNKLGEPAEFSLKDFGEPVSEKPDNKKPHLECDSTGETKEVLALINEYNAAYNIAAKEYNSGERVTTHAAEKLEDQVATGRAIAAKARAKDLDLVWLSKNVTGIKFALPSTAKAEGAPKTLDKRLDQIRYSLEKQYPGITSDSKHFEIVDKNAETNRAWYGFWGLTGVVTFKVPFDMFPDIIREMVSTTIATSKERGHSWVNDTVDGSSTRISNIYLCFAILDLFDDDYTFCDGADRNPFAQNFDNINAYGEKVECLHESKEEICCICGEPIEGYGNNPAPYKEEGRCCDACNLKFVIPARLEMMDKGE